VESQPLRDATERKRAKSSSGVNGCRISFWLHASESRVEEPSDSGNQEFQICEFTFPDSKYGPTQIAERLRMLGISRDIPCQFSVPILDGCLWFLSVEALRVGVLMPKASMHEDDFLSPPEYDIRPAWESRDMEPITVPEREN
jgi:hypothetical protein